MRRGGPRPLCSHRSAAGTTSPAKLPASASPCLDRHVARDSEGSSTETAFLGSWRITEMELWDQDAVDLLGPGHFSFAADRFGRFCFVAVQGDMDCRFEDRDGRPFVEFSWAGGDDSDPASGRGWAAVDGDVLTGVIYIHGGDESEFTATRQELPQSTRPSQGRRPRHGP